MVKNLYFDYSAFAVILIMLIALRFKRGLKGRTNRAFSYLVITMAYATMYDICAVFLDNYQYDNYAFKYIMHGGYLVLRNLVPLMYVYYIITLTNTWHILIKKSKKYSFIYVPITIVVLLIISSPVTKLVFYMDENCNYTRGPFFFVLYLSAIYYMSIGLFYSIKYYKLLTISNFIPLIMIVPLQALSTGIQAFRPKLLVELFFSAISLLFIMLTIQRPEAMIDPNTTLFRSGVYKENLRLCCINNKEIKIIYILITNYDSLNSLLSYKHMSKLLRQISSGLRKITQKIQFDESELYYLNNGKFAAIVNDYDDDKTDIFIDAVKDLFGKEFSLSDTTYSVPSNICILSVPEDLNEPDEIQAFEEDLSSFKFSSDVMDASEIVKEKDYKVVAKMDAILDKAIKNREFQVYYQPIYSLKEGRFNSAEALIRLNTKEYGFIRPDIFIPIAEENGRIHEIDSIVLEEVCKFISSDEFKGLSLDYIEVNLSIVQCMQPNLSSDILEMMNKYNINSSQINLEITETATEYSQKLINKNIAELHDAGILFSLDDFGTGYSNMARIASLPLHIVKLDRTFSTTKGNKGLLTILENTVEMIHKMGMKIVVEGVETKEMLDQFNELDCEYIQGYYFSRPLPKEDFIQFIHGNMNIS